MATGIALDVSVEEVSYHHWKRGSVQDVAERTSCLVPQLVYISALVHLVDNGMQSKTRTCVTEDMRITDMEINDMHMCYGTDK